MALEIVILAAGNGTRMRSDLPKVLHKLAGKPLLSHVINTALKLEPKAIHIVVGHGADKVSNLINSIDNKNTKLNIVLQKDQLGTGHAVMQALPDIDTNSTVLVLYGDTPLTPENLLLKLIENVQDNPLSVLTAITENPFGYGRIVRNKNGNLDRIVEQKDASTDELKIKEINTGILVSKAQILNDYLPKISNQNKQGEYYLTDLAGLLSSEGKIVKITVADKFELLSGVNSKSQLAYVERLFQKNNAERLMDEGVSFADPNRFDLRGELLHGKDCFIDTNVIIEGNVKIGDRVVIGSGCIIKDCEIDNDTILSPYTVMEGANLGKGTTVGPFARLRKGTNLKDTVHVGNFVEVKNSTLDIGTKSGHLSYLGDAVIGKNVNIGAGTITCNYDGANKFKTIIGDDVFVGSDTQLVAPVNVPDGVTIGAGSTITQRIDIPASALVFTRAKETIKANYQRPQKNKGVKK